MFHECLDSLKLMEKIYERKLTKEENERFIQAFSEGCDFADLMMDKPQAAK